MPVPTSDVPAERLAAAWLDAANHRYDVAVQAAAGIVDEALGSGDHELAAEAELVWALACVNDGRYRDVDVHVERLFGHLAQAPDPLSEGYGWMLRAVAGLRQQRLDESLEDLLHAEAAVATADGPPPPDWRGDRMVRLLSNIAASYSIAELYEEADRVAAAAIGAAQDGGHAVPLHLFRRGRNQFVWAIRHEHVGEYDDAVARFSAAAESYCAGLAEPADDRFLVERSVAEQALGVIECRRARLVRARPTAPPVPPADDDDETLDWATHAQASYALATGQPEQVIGLLTGLAPPGEVLLGVPPPDRLFLLCCAHEALDDHVAALAAHREMHRLYLAEAMVGRQRRLDAARGRIERAHLDSAARRYASESLTDPLTGLPNRRHLDAAFAALPPLADAGSYKIVLLDLDRFKDVNDRFGHLAGDRVLAAVGDVLRGELRGDDLLARYGGDEFLLLVTRPAADADDALLTRLAEAVAAHRWGDIHPDLRISVTTGSATSELGDRPGDVLARADERLLEAKHQR